MDLDWNDKTGLTIQIQNPILTLTHNLIHQIGLQSGLSNPVIQSSNISYKQIMRDNLRKVSHEVFTLLEHRFRCIRNQKSCLRVRLGFRRHLNVPITKFKCQITYYRGREKCQIIVTYYLKSDLKQNSLRLYQTCFKVYLAICAFF